MIVAIWAISVLAPVSVMAASGVTIFSQDDAHAARVGAAGTLHVENRAGVTQGSFNAQTHRFEVGYANLRTIRSPLRIAVTEVTLMGSGPGEGEPQFISLEAHIRTSGSGTCSNPTTGFTHIELRRVAVGVGSTLELNFDGPPLVIVSRIAGQLICFGFRTVSAPPGSVTHVGAIGYTFLP
jgi:hypothetical protein